MVFMFDLQCFGFGRVQLFQGLDVPLKLNLARVKRLQRTGMLCEQCRMRVLQRSNSVVVFLLYFGQRVFHLTSHSLMDLVFHFHQLIFHGLSVGIDLIGGGGHDIVVSTLGLLVLLHSLIQLFLRVLLQFSHGVQLLLQQGMLLLGLVQRRRERRGFFVDKSGKGGEQCIVVFRFLVGTG